MTGCNMQAKLVEKLNNLKLDLLEHEVSNGSLEMYLLNNVNMLLVSLDNSRRSEDIDKAVSVFARFCAESMDWDAPIYKQCSSLAEMGFKLAKAYKQKK